MRAARKHFELIILGGDNMLNGGASTVFSDLVDGTILVMEAEKTRAPVAKKLKQTVEDGGGKVIGAILNRRKHHIPDWIYKALYGARDR
jgi:Mrp family chromosome partitioning ATPase